MYEAFFCSTSSPAFDVRAQTLDNLIGIKLYPLFQFALLDDICGGLTEFFNSSEFKLNVADENLVKILFISINMSMSEFFKFE